MTAIDFRDDTSANRDPGLVHLASQVVQLLWAENNPEQQLRFSESARERILRKAGDLLVRLAEDTDTKRYEKEQPVFGSLPSPSDLQTSSCLLEAWEEAALDDTEDIAASRLGDDTFAGVQKKLRDGELPSLQAREALMNLFDAFARVVARRTYESPLHDVR